MRHRITITVTAAPRAGQPTRHIGTVHCAPCGWTDEHPTGSAEQSRAHAERNAADHRGTRPAPFTVRGLGIVR